MEWFKNLHIAFKIIIIFVSLSILSGIFGGCNSGSSSKFKPYKPEEIVFEGNFKDFMNKLNMNEINEGDIVKVSGHSRWGFGKFWEGNIDLKRRYSEEDGYSGYISMEDYKRYHQYYAKFYIHYVMFDSLLNNKNKFFIPKESNVTLIGKVKKFTVKLDQFNTTSITNQTHWDAEIWDCEIVQ